MASTLLPECLEKIFTKLLNRSNPIFSNSIETFEIKDLYSCTLVSRYWCQISTPLLYSYPFQHFRHLDLKKYKTGKESKDFQDYYKLIRTLLSCIPQSEIEEIINSTCEKESFTEPIVKSISPTFNYVKFIRELYFDDKFFVYDEKRGKQIIWMPSYIPINEIPEKVTSKLCNSIINHFVKYLCENCSNLITLEFLYKKLQIDLMESAKEKLKGLKKLYFTGPGKFGDELPNLTQLYIALSTTVLNLELLHNGEIISLEQANALSSLISSQKKLKHIILSDDLRNITFNNQISGWYNVVFNSLSTQKEWLESLEFVYLSFENIDEKALKSLCSLKLKELKLNKCKSLKIDLLRDWVKSLSNLKAIEYRAFSSLFLSSDIELLNMIFQTTSSTISKIVLDFKRDNDQGYQLIKDISKLYSHSLTHLEVPPLFSSELMSMFKSCTELVYFSTILINYGNDLNLGRVGKFVPKSVQMIQFKDVDFLEISSETLKNFLEGAKDGGKLEYLEITGKRKLSQEHFDVAKQFGVQLVNL